MIFLEAISSMSGHIESSVIMDGVRYDGRSACKNLLEDAVCFAEKV